MNIQKSITFFLEEEDKKKIENEAEKNKLSTSAFCRTFLLKNIQGETQNGY